MSEIQDPENGDLHARIVRAGPKPILPPRWAPRGDMTDHEGREDVRFSTINLLNQVVCYRCGWDKPTHQARRGFCVEFDSDLVRGTK